MSLLILFNPAVRAAESNQETITKKHKNVTYMFIETAEKGNLQKQKDGTFLLTLEGTDGWVTYFSNVPHRITGITSVEDFSKMMNTEIKRVYPQGLNSGLVAIDSKTQNKVRYMFSLAEPNYNKQNETVTFIAHEIPGEHKNPLPAQTKFEHISLFIDNWCINCSPY